MGNSPTANQKILMNKLQIKPEQIKQIDDKYYLSQSRKEFKLGNSTLKAFELNNNFSCEQEDDYNCKVIRK